MFRYIVGGIFDKEIRTLDFFRNLGLVDMRGYNICVFLKRKGGFWVFDFKI